MSLRIFLSSCYSSARTMPYRNFGNKARIEQCETMRNVSRRTILSCKCHDSRTGNMSSWLLLSVWSQPVGRNSQHVHSFGNDEVRTLSAWVLLLVRNDGSRGLSCRNILRRRERAAVALRGGHVQRAGGPITVRCVPSRVHVQPFGSRQLLCGDVLRCSEHIGMC